ncbi:M15 family metallopeptidase [Halomonas sp. V046]|uniref:M15 family metallopeptidase n=1 Tax=Halomonas sp. V046 TaxID=3459611 RepID=UPI0040448AF9
MNERIKKFHLSDRSLSNLNGVHPDLIRIVHLALTLSDVDFGVLEGRRSKERQQTLVASGASKTMNSRHLTGHAVDLAAYIGGRIRWDWPLYYRIADAMKAAARAAAVPIEWGGDWPRFKDGPHFQLSWKEYPA